MSISKEQKKEIEETLDLGNKANLILADKIDNVGKKVSDNAEGSKQGTEAILEAINNIPEPDPIEIPQPIDNTEKLEEILQEVKKKKEVTDLQISPELKEELKGEKGERGENGESIKGETGDNGEDGKDIPESIVEELKEEFARKLEEIEERFTKSISARRPLGHGGGRIETFVSEAPTGTVNGTNDTFYLSTTPKKNSLKLFWNSDVQRPTSSTEYVLTGKKIVFNTDSIPTVGEVWAFYSKF